MTHVWFLLFALCIGGCSLFEPREAEPPTQSGAQYEQQTLPHAVISNLQKAIAQKDDLHYIACFTNPARNQRGFTFVPSADAADVYASVLRNWTHDQELMYFRNLKAKARQPNGFSNLTLVSKPDSVITTDSREYGYDYTLTFEHTDTTFTTTVRGALRFSLINDNSEWTISRWVDLKTTNDLTWSSLKGKFSN